MVERERKGDGFEIMIRNSKVKWAMPITIPMGKKFCRVEVEA